MIVRHRGDGPVLCLLVRNPAPERAAHTIDDGADNGRHNSNTTPEIVYAKLQILAPHWSPTTVVAK